MTLTTAPEGGGLKRMRAPFPDNQISKLPKPTVSMDQWKQLPKGKCQECGGWHATSKTMHLDYVGHAALTDRLLDCDPNWTWEPMATEDGLPMFDKSGGLWIRLTVCGVTRIGYGNASTVNKDAGNREKEVIGDALRNAAMRFGAALELWHKGVLHDDDDGEAAAAPPRQQPKPKAAAKPNAAIAGAVATAPFDLVEEAVAAINAAAGLGIDVVGRRISASGFTGEDLATVREAYARRREELA